MFGPLKVSIGGVYVSTEGEGQNAAHSFWQTHPNFLAESQSWLDAEPSALKRGGNYIGI
jgi:hypothetical protein